MSSVNTISSPQASSPTMKEVGEKNPKGENKPVSLSQIFKKSPFTSTAVTATVVLGVAALGYAVCAYGPGMLEGASDYGSQLMNSISEQFTERFGTVIEEGYCTETLQVDNTWGLGLFGQVDTITNKLPFGSLGDALECKAPVKSFEATVNSAMSNIPSFASIVDSVWSSNVSFTGA